MKRLLLPVCLVACLFIATSCDSAISDASNAIRRGWDKLNGRGPAEPDPEPKDFSTIGDIPGAPLTDAEKTIIVKVEALRKLAAAADSVPEAGDSKVVAEREKLDKIYPPARPPKDRATIDQAMDELFPKRLGKFVYSEGSVEQQGEGEEYREELIPNLYFATDTSYFAGTRLYRKDENTRMIVSVVDRGNLAQWVRIGHWYYLLKGVVGEEEKYHFKFSETVQKNGRTWVVWESKQHGKKFYILWHGRWQVWADGVEDPDDLKEIFAAKWLDTM